jgi:hypothetical protein
VLVIKLAGLVTLVTLVALAGCSLGGDGNGAAVERRQLRDIALQPADLSPAFVRFDEGRQGFTDNPGGSRTDASRFGRVDGWKARFRRVGSPDTQGPLVVESRADIFDSSDGATEELEALRRDVRERTGWQQVEVSGMGDEAAGFTLLQGQAELRVAYHLVVWRQENVVASISVNGFARALPFADALELARKQARRIEGAAAAPAT